MQIMMGARLAFVAVELEGTVERPVHKWVKGKGIVPKNVPQPAGYLVYFPMGHVIRLTREQLVHYGLDGEPRIINMQGLHDPRSPIGKLMSSQDEEVRRGAYADLKQQVIRAATVKAGPVMMPEQLEAPAAA